MVRWTRLQILKIDIFFTILVTVVLAAKEAHGRTKVLYCLGWALTSGMSSVLGKPCTSRQDIATMSAIYILAGICILLVAIYRYLTSTYGYWKKQGIPTIGGTIPGIGNIAPMLLMRRNFPNLYRDFYDQTPDHSMIGFYKMRQPALLLKDPELVKSVLQVNFSNFVDNEMSVDPHLDPLMAANPFFLKGDRWKNTRKQFASAFTTSKVKALHITVSDVCEKLSKYLDQLATKEGGSIEVETKALFSRYTAEVVANAAFGVEGGSLKGEDDGPFREVGRLMFEPTIGKGVTQLITFFIPALRRVFKVSFMPPDVEKFLRKAISDILKYREGKDIQGNDFLQLLIQLKNSGAEDHAFETEFNENTITSHASSFFLDVYESSSVTLSFLNYHIAKHPEIQQRVRNEVNTKVKKHGGLTYEALQEMTYLEQVIQESMRLNPALGAMSKVCTKATDLEGSDGLKCHVTPGTPIAIPVFCLQMDPKYWSDPEKFDPERFSEENKHKRHKFLWLPFGEGPRICVGIRMAILLMKAATATILRSYSMKVSTRTKEPLELDQNYFLSSVIGGTWINIERL